ncbi:MAG: hypothetical protein HQ517_00930 [SAR324 cluster bacterium]|nr:hypothetical protein [SAR324 cluster bacterium]
MILVFPVIDGSLFGQVPRNVYNFDVHGLKLNMNMNMIIKQIKVTNIKVNKDASGLINGYEIKKQFNQEKRVLLLSFTGEKRLYRIQSSKLYKNFGSRPKELLELLIKKYGTPWTYKIDVGDQKSKDIHACWGAPVINIPRQHRFWMPIFTMQAAD